MARPLLEPRGIARGRTTLAVIAAEAGVSLPTVSKVVNGRPDVAADTRGQGGAAARRAPVHPGRNGQAASLRPHRPGVRRPGQPVGRGDLARRRGVGREPRDRRRRLGGPARQRPARQLDQRAGQPRHRRRDRGDLRDHRGPAGAAAQRRHPAGRGRPGQPAAARPGQRRRHQLGRRPGRHRAPARPRPSPDRAPSAGRRTTCAAGPGSTVTVRPSSGTASPSTGRWYGTATSSTRAASGPAGNCSTWPRPTAIFACNDQQALGVYEAARQRGLRIPQDLSVVGFDDLPVARWVSPPLTTVRQPLAEMGRAAAQMLGELVEDRPLPSRRVELSTELITRESTGRPVAGTQPPRDAAGPGRRWSSGATRPARPPSGSRTCSAG